MNPLKTSLKTSLIFLALTCSINTQALNNQTSCSPTTSDIIPDIKKAYNTIALTDTLAASTIVLAKNAKTNPDMNTIFKQAYILAASWEFNLNALNYNLPNNTNYHPINIMKYCALNNFYEPNLFTQMNAWADTAIFWFGVKLAEVGLKQPNPRNLFNTPKLKSNVIAIMTLWGMVQEYLVESSNNNKVWLYIEADPQKKINPTFMPGHTTLAQLMWLIYPTYYYDILNKKFSNQSTNTNQNLPDISLSESLKNIAKEINEPNLARLFNDMAKNPDLIKNLNSLRPINYKKFLRRFYKFMSKYDNKLSYKIYDSSYLKNNLSSKTYDSNDLNNSKLHIAYNATIPAIWANVYFKSEMGWRKPPLDNNSQSQTQRIINDLKDNLNVLDALTKTNPPANMRDALTAMRCQFSDEDVSNGCNNYSKDNDDNQYKVTAELYDTFVSN